MSLLRRSSTFVPMAPTTWSEGRWRCSTRSSAGALDCRRLRRIEVGELCADADLSLVVGKRHPLTLQSRRTTPPASGSTASPHSLTVPSNPAHAQPVDPDLLRQRQVTPILALTTYFIVFN